MSSEELSQPFRLPPILYVTALLLDVAQLLFRSFCYRSNAQVPMFIRIGPSQTSLKTSLKHAPPPRGPQGISVIISTKTEVLRSNPPLRVFRE